MSKGIDVSKHNGTIDWTKVNADFAIIRCGYGREASQKDSQFEANYKGAKAAGIPVGVYHYSYAKTVAEALVEADVVISWLKGKQFEFPIYFDIEDESQVPLGSGICSSMTRAFCEKLEAAGYWVGVYSFDSFFSSNLDAGIPARFACWVARVPTNDDGSTVIKPKYCNAYGTHQFSWKGKIDGINGDVDLNIGYVDYATLIKRQKLNGFGDVPTYKVTGTATGLSETDANALVTKMNALGLKTTRTDEL